MKGKSEHAYYMKELMRLMPLADQASRNIFTAEQELREAWQTEKAERFRRIKIELYFICIDCRIYNGELIEAAPLNAKQRRLMRYRYVKGYPWSRLFSTQAYSPSHCKRIHRDAVTKIASNNQGTDFRPMYEELRARMADLLAEVDEVIE